MFYAKPKSHLIMRALKLKQTEILDNIRTLTSTRHIGSNTDRHLRMSYFPFPMNYFRENIDDEGEAKRTHVSKPLFLQESSQNSDPMVFWRGVGWTRETDDL